MTATDSLIIAHAACRDGFAAAWVARHYLLSKDRTVEVYFAYHNTEPPWEQIKGRNVYVLDFAYKRSLMDKIAKEAKTITVLDHHKTAEEDLKGFAGAIFDMSRSGAGMTWDFFYPDKQRPWLVKYVEDRDLWTYKLSQSEAVNAFISTLPYDYDAWTDKALHMEWQDAAPIGSAVVGKTKHYVEELKKNAVRIDFEGYNIPCVNAPHVDISELVGELAKNEPFAMGWWQLGDGRFKYSLRSNNDIDVSVIAKKYGGGGHAKAAGFDQEYPFHLQDDMDAQLPWKTWLMVTSSIVVLWILVSLFPFS